LAQSRQLLLAAVVLAGLLLAACGPEAARTRGGGPGADVGNRVLGPAMDIHGQVNPDYGESIYGKAVPDSR
jgi:hypothetical protein